MCNCILADRFGSVLPKLGQLVELFMEIALLIEFFLISYNDMILFTAYNDHGLCSPERELSWHA